MAQVEGDVKGESADLEMESGLLAQNKPRPFLAHCPGRHEPHPVQHRLRGGIAGVSFGLDGGDAGLFEGPAAGGADSLGGVALMFIFRQKAVANFRLTVFGQALKQRSPTQSPESFR